MSAEAARQALEVLVRADPTEFWDETTRLAVVATAAGALAALREQASRDTALRKKVERAFATENGTGQTNPLARDFLDTSDRLEIYIQASRAWLAALAAARAGETT